MAQAVRRGAGWDDYIVSGLDIRNHPSANPPTFEQIGTTGLYAYHFDVNSQGWFNIHILHDYLAGSKVYPHVHWEHNGVSNGEDVVFEIAYSPAKGYSQQAYPAIVTFNLTCTPHATTNMHQIDEASEAQAFSTNLEVDSLVKCRIKRITNGGTDFNGKVYVDQLDFHVQTDGLRTNQKNYPFTKRM